MGRAISRNFVTNLKYNTHVLGVEHVIKNLDDWLRDSSAPTNVHRSIMEDVVVKSGLFSCQSDLEFDEMLENMIKKWGNTVKEYIKYPKSKLSDYFIEKKAEKEIK